MATKSQTELIRAATLVEQAVRILEAAGAIDLAADLRQVQADIETAVAMPNKPQTYHVLSVA